MAVDISSLEKPMNTYDAVIIGAGHNGLANAVHLAARGWKVAVVETNAEAGGAVKTREVTLPGFRHDLAAMNLSAFAGSAFCQTYRDDLERHGLGFVPVDACFTSVFRDGSHLAVYADLEKTVAGIAALSKHDADAWREMVAEFQSDAPYIFGLLGSAMPSLGTVRTALRAWRNKGTPWLMRTLRMLVSSPREFLEPRFETGQMIALMSAWGLHMDFGPDSAGGAIYPYLESMGCQTSGMMIGKGGADTIIKAMTGLLVEKGGDLFLNSPVTRVTTEAGRATGVTLQDGQRLIARKAVISDAHPKLLFTKLLEADAVPAEVREEMKSFRHGPGTMMIHLAMDGLPDWTAGDELKRFAYVHVAPDLAMMSRAYSDAMNGLLPAEPAVVVGQPTAIDPSRAPSGKHALWLQVRVVPAVIAADAAGTIASTDWGEIKDRYADRVLDILETYAPGLRTKILARAVFSPQDLEHEDANLIGGDNLAGSMHLMQNFLFRPIAGYSRYRTPVKSLYMCGASTWPGGGTGAGSGFLLARMLAGG